jgi:tripartite-type tricarboxylate transporter receptor subunit TctC
MQVFRTLMMLVALIAGLQATQAQTSQDWPNRPVRLIVPFAAGGSTDVAARLIGDYLSRTAGQQFYVENRTGANGVIGMDAAAKSDPHVYKVGHDPLKDFAPVIQLSRQPVVLAVHPSLGVNTLDELVTLAKREPGLRYATGSGQGSPQHMVVQWFAKLAGIELEQVAYRGGGAAINDLIAGHVKLGALGSTPLIPHYKAGALRLLAQTTAKRSESLPDVPTFEEAGIKGLVLDQWLGVLVTAGTPPAIVARLNTDIAKALADPAIRAILVQSAQEPIGGTPEAFGTRVREDWDKYRRLVEDLNIKVAK